MSASAFIPKLWRQAIAVSSRHTRFSSRNLSVSATRRDIFDVQSKSDFNARVLKATKPVVVDFHAEWCGPCKELGPLIAKVVESRKGKVDLAKVDIDELQELAIEYGVNAVPTVVLVNEGKQVEKFVGSQPTDFLENFVPK